MLPCLLRRTTSLRLRHVSLVCKKSFYFESKWINFGQAIFTRKITMSGNQDNSAIEPLRSSVKEQVNIN